MIERAYPDRPIVGVGAVILEEDRVVLVKRRREPLAGRWSLPGGAVEVGETLEQAIAREVVEETGLVVAVRSVIDVFDRIVEDDEGRVQYHYILIEYLCARTGGTLRHGSDVSDAVEVSALALDPYQLTPLTESIITRALRMASGGVAGLAPL